MEVYVKEIVRASGDSYYIKKFYLALMIPIPYEMDIESATKQFETLYNEYKKFLRSLSSKIDFKFEIYTNKGPEGSFLEMYASYKGYKNDSFAIAVKENFSDF